MKITALSGGVGGAKMLVGLDRALGPDDPLAAIVNTGDDAVIYSVHVSPDIDIVTYWLAGLADTERGWGLRDDTFTIVDALAQLGGEAWFRLGDRDFATCLFRTEKLAAGATLTQVTDAVRRALGVGARILPMSDEAVRTRFICTDDTVLDFQEYFVKHRCEPEVAEVLLAGISDATPAPGVLESIEEADVVVVCPSNPVVSTGPILAIRGIRSALRAHRNVVAVTPIVQGAALRGPADKLLAATGAQVSAAGVAALYADFCDLFVVDRLDAAEIVKIEAWGVHAVALDTIMSDHGAAERLARSILKEALPAS